MHGPRSYRRIAALLLMLLACGCASVDEGSTSPDYQEPVLTIDPASFYGGGSAEFKLISHYNEDALTVEVHAQDAQKLKALYFTLEHSPHLGLTDSEFSSELYGNSEPITLTHEPRPGQLVAGTIGADPDHRTGFTGSTVVATLRFGSRTTLRSVSLPPMLQSARMPFFQSASDTGYHISWNYTNPGDYDQNGEVNISDLTPIARYYNQLSTASAAAAVVDGDGNGLIYLGDIAPIGANYGGRVGAYNLYGSNSPDDYPQESEQQSVLEPFQTIPIGQGYTHPDGGSITFLIETREFYNHYWVRPVDGETEGIASELGSWPEYFPPVAVIDAEPLEGIAPLTVEFDATRSTASSEGVQILEYYWDFDSDGTEDFADVLPQASHTFDIPGQYIVRLRVVDDFIWRNEAATEIAISVNPAE